MSSHGPYAPPGHPRPPQFQPELWKNKFLWKTRFFSFSLIGSKYGGVDQKGIQKVAILSTKKCLRLLSFPENIVFLGVIFQNGFSPKAVQPETIGFRGDPKANLEVFCHEATFQFTVKCWKVDFLCHVRPNPVKNREKIAYAPCASPGHP